LSLELRAPSLLAHVSYGGMGLGALAPWVFLPVKPAFGLAIATAALLCLGFRLAGWVGPRLPLRRLSWISDGRWFVEDLNGESTECELHHSSRIFGRNVWLRLIASNAEHTDPAHPEPPRYLTQYLHQRLCYRLWVTRFNLRHPAQLRALIVRLRFDQAPAPAAGLEVHG
jgi:hypothetical protein